jgi:hypothetical protein
MTTNKFILFAFISAALSAFVSAMLWAVSGSFKTYHWYLSLVFFLLLFSALFLFRKSSNDATSAIYNIMTASVGRLLASAMAFLIYGYLYPYGKNAMLAHFIPHYFIFTGTELCFLLKLAKNNASS